MSAKLKTPIDAHSLSTSYWITVQDPVYIDIKNAGIGTLKMRLEPEQLYQLSYDLLYCDDLHAHAGCDLMASIDGVEYKPIYELTTVGIFVQKPEIA